MLKSTTIISQHLHQKCLLSLPQKAQNLDDLASLVCGEKITDTKLNENLRKTSLLHIFIVSGSHLILLDELLSILKIPVFLRFLFLVFYSLCVGWQPPAVRALLGLLFRQWFRNKKIFFPSDITVLITGLATLILFPQWWSSSSLVMSWCAALALSFPAILRIKSAWQRLILSQFSIFFFMSAPLWGLGSLHPLSILYNLILAPTVSYILLPISFLAALFSPFLFVFDKLILLFANTLAVVSEPIEISKTSQPGIGVLWIWVFAWQMFYHFLRLHLWQGKDSQ
ncbi:MAG: ComEC/Rec2 family competence protein [Bdellovibrio sp.]